MHGFNIHIQHIPIFYDGLKNLVLYVCVHTTLLQYVQFCYIKFYFFFITMMLIIIIIINELISSLIEFVISRSEEIDRVCNFYVKRRKGRQPLRHICQAKSLTCQGLPARRARSSLPSELQNV